MQHLIVHLENCYGIRHLDTAFNFDKARSAAIYAPNGAMKTSFAQTFEDLSQGKNSLDRIFPGRATVRNIADESGNPIPSESVVVLRSYSETFSSGKTATLLVDAALRAEYEGLLADRDSAAAAFVKALRDTAGSKKLDERAVSLGFMKSDEEFYQALVRVRQEVQDMGEPAFSDIRYDRVFDDAVVGFIKTKDFKDAIEAYITRYDQLIAASTFFKKGTFNYYNASTIAKNLAANGFFKAKHSLTLRGAKVVEIESEKDLEGLVQSELDSMSNDDALRSKFAEIAKQLERNADLRAFHQYLLDNQKILPSLSNIDKFKEDLLKSYFKSNEAQYVNLVDLYLATEKRKKEIEDTAGKQRTRWERVIEIFNDRFTVPFRLVARNKIASMLNPSTPLVLDFVFNDGDEATVDQTNLLRTLSTGERKALYVLNIIFEVEARRISGQSTLFVVDDIADSFDYKNKYAIIEYLKEMSEVDHFTLIVLTHNFDFLRTICGRVVMYPNCKMAFKSNGELKIEQAKGINNVFLNDWKNAYFKDQKKKLACVPFIRNIIEYTRGTDSAEYMLLTSLLHVKAESDTITVAQLDETFSSVFGISGDSENPAQPVVELQLEMAKACLTDPPGFNFENKIVLSMAIRLAAERYMIKKIADPDFVDAIKSKQTGRLFDRFKKQFENDEVSLQTLHRVMLMTPESIHLNSFMYEPILDMSDDHLRKLYRDVLALG